MKKQITREIASATSMSRSKQKEKNAAVVPSFWSVPAEELFKHLHSSYRGLTDNQAKRSLGKRSHKTVQPRWKRDLLLLAHQYKSPLVLLLIFAIALSVILAEYSDGAIILMVLLFTGVFGFLQERNANMAVEKLTALVHSKATVRRNNIVKTITIEKVVPGDILLLSAGNIVPADALLLEVNDLHVNESTLTGESFPSEKNTTSTAADVSLLQVTNAVFKGTSIINGSATALAVNTGENTRLGKIAASLADQTNETSFEKGIRKFGYLLLQLTVILTVVILSLNILFHKPFIDSLLFSLALAVGLTPELLPAIVTITLSAGAQNLAAKKVIVKKLSAIQNLGQMNVFCSDKTGTLTEGVVNIHSAISFDGQPSEKTMLYAKINASFETGFSNIIDEALRTVSLQGIEEYTKIDEVPYDFIRKRLSVVVAHTDKHIMITKGAVANVLDVCTHAEQTNGAMVDIDTVKKSIEHQFGEASQQGFRTVAVACKDVTDDPIINKDDETGMCLLGFILLSDPPKKEILKTIGELKELGVVLKIISGDNRLVVKHLAEVIGVSSAEMITGEEMHLLTTNALQAKAASVNIFSEIEPAQKEQIIRALQNAGNTVGYLGDGINDANALHAADIGISIDNAVDIAKEAADLVLLERDIEVIIAGVREGRKTFMNTMKYIFVTTSANFGNMFSMAIASLWLPFLPLLPTQILLNNFLADLPALTIASDHVDEELTTTPRKWDVRYINRFMLTFGLQSSLFDLATFGVLLYVFHSTPIQFRTGWFTESLLTQILILLVIRTQRPFFKSLPSKYLVIACLFTVSICLLLPYMPFANIFRFQPLPFHLLAIIAVIAIVYMLSAELSKRFLIRKL